MKRKYLVVVVMAVGAVMLLSSAWIGSAQQGPPARQTSPVLGQAFDDLTFDQRERFDAGQAAFSSTETRPDGLGPVFNGTSCAECHKSGAIGGAGTDLTVSRVTRIGALRNGVYSDLPEVGGPVLQVRSLKEFDTACPILGEVVPTQATFVSRRATTPLFGAGLIEAIPEAAILAQTGRADPDGVAGIPNMLVDPVTGQRRVGRFGWKSQHFNLEAFSADAYLNEMGITSPTASRENLPQGRPIPAGWDSVADPEDNDGDVEKFVSFMRFLAPPGRRLPIGTQMLAGERVFQNIRCVACHTPSFTTGLNPVAALSNKTVALYSDLLLHRMGQGLADGIRQGQAQGDHWRTAPLWGLSRRSLFLHDGRARTVQEAVTLHGGEATASRDRFSRLLPQDRDALLAFLNSL